MKARMLLVTGALLFAPAALGESLEGVVRTVGSALNQKVLVTPGSDFSGPQLCRDEEAKKISRLTSFTVKVDGAWKMTKEGKQDCFDAATYTVTKTLNGRPALVGVLSKEGSGFVVTATDGSKHPLTEVPEGMKSMVGKKVILDLKPMDNPALKEAASKVVTYSEMP